MGYSLLGAAAIVATLALTGAGRVFAQSAIYPEVVVLRVDNSFVPGDASSTDRAFAAVSLAAPAAPASMIEPVREAIAMQPELSANPGRPAMATSALLTPEGYAQVENGLLYAAVSAQFSRRDGLEETVRVTVAPRLQFIVSAEPMAYSTTSSRNLTQRGDVDGGLQVVALSGRGAKPTISMSYLRLARGGNATDLDIGGYANSAILLASSDFGHCHVDANGFLSETEGTVRRLQFGQAVALSYPLSAKLSGTAELRHFTEPLNTRKGGGNGASALAALSYAVHPNLVFDVGMVRGFTESSTHWQIASGFTYVLPQRLWGFPRR